MSLATARRIVNRHGGTMTADGQLGRGHLRLHPAQSQCLRATPAGQTAQRLDQIGVLGAVGCPDDLGTLLPGQLDHQQPSIPWRGKSDASSVFKGEA